MSTPSKPRPEEKKLDALNALDPMADRATLNAAIRAALEDKHYRVVAKGALLAQDRSLPECIPDLQLAYARFLHDPVKRDPNCVAKQAIARALVALECQDVAFYLEGIRYVQLEPVWGGTADRAVDVRCSCALGLVNTGHFRAIPELVALLNDEEAGARIGAARAISCGHRGEAEALLRFKVLAGDAEPEVLSECFSGLLSIAAEECLPLVAQQLSHEDAHVRDYAALALGESHHPGALKHLRDAWDNGFASRDMQAVLIRAAAVHRSEEAFEWLVSLIESGTQTQADVAVDALAVYERNTRLHERVQAALAQRPTRRSQET
jgi:HEAT repeat protein